jgi:hypothetical protein
MLSDTKRAVLCAGKPVPQISLADRGLRDSPPSDVPAFLSAPSTMCTKEAAASLTPAGGGMLPCPNTEDVPTPSSAGTPLAAAAVEEGEGTTTPGPSLGPQQASLEEGIASMDDMGGKNTVPPPCVARPD